IICLALIVLVGVFAYWNSFKVPFVFDDDPIIAGNINLREFGTTITGTYHSRVVGFLTFALNYKINGLDVTGYHAFNLAIHLTSALLVFWLVTLTLKTPFLKQSRLSRPASVPLTVALFCALIFVAHPVQTQAVTYIVQRFASLATMFYLLAVVMYAKWRLSAEDPKAAGLFGGRITVDLPVKRGFFFAASLAATLLAMGTKENAVTLPAVLALWEFSFFGGAVKKRLAGLLPFALTLPVIPLVQVIGGMSLTSAPGVPGVTSPPPAIDYLLTQLRVIVTYIRLLFFPSGQNLDYDYPVYRSFLDPNVFMSFVFLLLVAGLGVFLWRHAKREAGYAPLRLIAFGIFWFFITLSVESSFITIADVIFEHRLYLPSAGLIIAVVVAAAMATESLQERVAWIARAAVPLAAAAVVALSLATFSRNQAWADPITLWQDTVAKSPGKARAHYNLGFYLQHSGQIERAKAE
ncbi:MAG: tetratricopeptide repeat protein, partial [Actinomycetota bacterium]